MASWVSRALRRKCFIVRKVPRVLVAWVFSQRSRGRSQIGWEVDSSVMPALAMRILRGPWWAFAWWMEELMEASEEMSPITVKRLGEAEIWVIGRRSWAVTLQPCSGRC